MNPYEKIQYGEKTFIEGDQFEMYGYNVTCMYVSEQIIRFKVSWDEKIMVLQKFLNQLKIKQPWRILSVNFVFEIEGEDKTGKWINDIFYHLDDYIKPKNRYDRSNKG